MISQTSEYALRAVVHLAQIGGGPAITSQIAGATNVPLGYLQKVLRMLARAGILDAQRGVGGGFTLAKVASAISVLDVLKATDTSITRIERCPLGIKGHTSLCALHRLLDQEIANTERTFAMTSIANLLEDSHEIPPLCDPREVTQLGISAQSDQNQSGGGEAV